MTRTILFLRIHFVFYSVASVCMVLYFGFFGLATMMASLSDGDEEGIIMSIVFSIFALFPVLMLILNTIAAFRVRIRSNANWIFMVVLICFGFVNPYTILPSIFMLIMLLDEEVKEYYRNPGIEAEDVQVV